MKAGVENGAMLTTYLFRYTSECTISQSNFQNFLCLRRQRGVDPPNQNPADALATVSCHSHPALLHYCSFTTTTAAVRRADTQNTKQGHQVTQAQRMLRAVMATRTRKCNANTDSTTVCEQWQDHE